MRQFAQAFVGRKRELFQLSSALDRARSGGGSVFLLSGEPGVGKTRLAEEFTDFARSRGVKVLAGRAHRRPSAPFEVWKQILPSNSSAGDSKAAIRDVVGNAVVSDSSAFAEPHSPAGRAEWFEATARRLIESARVQPLILMLDDLHAADAHSLDAFRIFARELSRSGSIAIGIYRDSEIKRLREFGELLGDAAGRDCQRIALGTFDDNEVREFVESRTAAAVDKGSLESLLKFTGGNPRLLDIAVRLNLQQSDGLAMGARMRGLLRAEIETHLESLAPELRQILVAASVIGTEFELPLLARACECSAVQLLDALAEVERVGLVTKERPGRYRFRQSLVCEALYDELSGASRALLHLRIGRLLEDLYSDDPAYLARIAHHYYEAIMVGDVAKAVEYCRRAAEFADSIGDLKEASELYEMAISALTFQAAPDAACRRELALKLQEVNARKDGSAGVMTKTVPKPEYAPRDFVVVPSPNSSDPPRLQPNSHFSGSPVNTNSETSNIVADNDGAVLVGSPENHAANIFRCEGEFWTLKFEEKTLRIKDCNGLKFVAHLLHHPGREFHAVQLAAVLHSAGRFEAGVLSRTDRQNLTVRSNLSGDTGPILDNLAKSAYRGRIERLRDEIQEARSFNDPARVSQLEDELSGIESELGRALGIAGRDRKHSSESERARVNVTNAIRHLTKKIRRHHASLGRYLSNTIKTGYFCSYNPDAQSPRQWLL